MSTAKSLCIIPFLLLSGVAGALPSVQSFQLQRDNSGKPGAVVEYFKPQDHKIHLTVKFDQLKIGKTKVRFSFVAVDTSAGRNKVIKDLDLNAVAASEAHAEVSLPRDWPFGQYRADVSVDGKIVKSITYYVSPAPAELKPLGSVLLKDDGKGGEGKKVTHFNADDHKLHFLVEVNGYMMGKVNTTWTYVAVKTASGNNRKIISENKDVSNLKGNTLTGFVSLPGKWPVGTYRAEVAINGKALTQIPFEVKP